MIDNTVFGNLTAEYHTLGCKLNFAETSTIGKMLSEKGVRPVAKGETPDICVVNTCTVTELANKKCRQEIRRIASRYPDAVIVVTGCYAQLKGDEVAAIDGVDIVAGNDRKDEIAAFIERFLSERRPVLEITPLKDMRRFIPSCSKGDRTRYFLKVQDGCDYYCSYCAIPRARGRSRSGRIADLAEQARQVASAGGKEIVITGVNIGDFGKNTGESFLDLVSELEKIDGIERYRISSLEPDLLTDELIAFTARSRRFMPHFHIPLQSGSDAVLKLMRRHYGTALFAHKIEEIRRLMPDAFIGVDLITGMRGETDELFEESKAFVESLDISRLHVFTYSERPDTAALKIPHVVMPQAKHARTRMMIEVSDSKWAAFASRFVGTVRPVLFEHTFDRRGMMKGFTDNYLRVEVPADETLANKVVDVRIAGFADEEELMKGEIV